MDPLSSAVMTLIIIIFGDFSSTDGGSHDVFSEMSERFLCSDSRERSVAGSLVFFIDVILAEISILGVN